MVRKTGQKVRIPHRRETQVVHHSKPHVRIPHRAKRKAAYASKKAYPPRPLSALKGYARLKKLALKWRLIAEFTRLVIISSRVRNLEAPINLCLVGPPGDGKTKMLMRAKDVPHVRVFSDLSPKGVLSFLDLVKNGFVTTLVVPDLGTIIGRKAEIGKQVISNLAMMCAEGVHQIAVYGRMKDYEGARASLLTAITPTNFIEAVRMLEQNGFTSRLFVVDFDFLAEELLHMQSRKLLGDRTLMRPFSYPRAGMRAGLYPLRSVRVPRSHASTALEWWKTVMSKAPEHVYGFRTADALVGLLQSSAYLHGRKTVTTDDVKYIKRFEQLWLKQFIVTRKGGGQ